MNELTPELQEKIHAVWDKKVLTPVQASRRVNEASTQRGPVLLNASRAGLQPFVPRVAAGTLGRSASGHPR
jgi:hypothetical protein